MIHSGDRQFGALIQNGFDGGDDASRSTAEHLHHAVLAQTSSHVAHVEASSAHLEGREDEGSREEEGEEEDKDALLNQADR